jgi:fructose/tagatose bisphosphate aldolase
VRSVAQTNTEAVGYRENRPDQECDAGAAYLAWRIGNRRRRFAEGIAGGINITHVNTELRVAWRRGLEEGLAKQPYEVVPYKILPFAVESVKKAARSRLKLFNADR